jgi:hypothetical protein
VASFYLAVSGILNCSVGCSRLRLLRYIGNLCLFCPFLFSVYDLAWFASRSMVICYSLRGAAHTHQVGACWILCYNKRAIGTPDQYDRLGLGGNCYEEIEGNSLDYEEIEGNSLDRASACRSSWATSSFFDEGGGTKIYFLYSFFIIIINFLC